MPVAPYQVTPRIEPDAAPPSDYQNIQANPNDFGALQGQATQKLGQAGAQASADLTQIALIKQDRFNQTTTDGAVTKFQNQGEALTYGNKADPNAPAGLYTLKGQAALDAGPQAMQKLSDVRQQIRDGLQNDAQKLEFDKQTNRYLIYKQSEIANHLNQASDQYQVANAKAGIDSEANIAGNSFNSDHSILASLSNSSALADKITGTHFGANPDPKLIEQGQMEAHSQVIMSAVDGALAQPGQAPRALEIMQRFGGLVDPKIREEMMQRVQAKADQQTGLNAAQNAIASNLGGAPLPGVYSQADIQMAILAQESGGHANAPRSVTGATGQYQIQLATFRQYAMPGEDINNPPDNKKGGARIINDLYQRAGGDPARVSVGYFSGRGNIAPAGNPTPWKRDVADPTGKTVSSYVHDINERLNQGKASAYRQVISDPTLSDNARQHALDSMNRQFSAASIAVEADNRAKRELNENAANDWSQKINGGATPDMIDRISNDPRITNYETRNNLISLAEKRGVDDIRKYGSGYTSVYNGMFASPDDPSRINDINDILKRGAPGGDLTTAGVERLVRVYAESKKSDDDAGIHTTAASLLKYAKTKSSFENDEDQFSPKDRVGEEIFNAKFVPKFEAALSAWRKAGKDPMQFLTQENVDKLREGMRSPAQMAQDRIAATGQSVPGEIEQPGTPIPPAPNGMNEGEWKSIMTVPPKAENGTPYTHAAWAQAMQMLMANPDEKNINHFNDFFGKQGYNGAEIVNRLKKQDQQWFDPWQGVE